MQVLADPKNKEVYAKTVFILNYDEGPSVFEVLLKTNGTQVASSLTITGLQTLQALEKMVPAPLQPREK